MFLHRVFDGERSATIAALSFKALASICDEEEVFPWPPLDVVSIKEVLLGETVTVSFEDPEWAKWVPEEGVRMTQEDGTIKIAARAEEWLEWIEEENPECDAVVLERPL